MVFGGEEVGGWRWKGVCNGLALARFVCWVDTSEIGVRLRVFYYRRNDQSVKTVDSKTTEHEVDLWRCDHIRCRPLGSEMGMRLLAM